MSKVMIALLAVLLLLGIVYCIALVVHPIITIALTLLAIFWWISRKIFR